MLLKVNDFASIISINMLFTLILVVAFLFTIFFFLGLLVDFCLLVYDLNKFIVFVFNFNVKRCKSFLYFSILDINCSLSFRTQKEKCLSYTSVKKFKLSTCFYKPRLHFPNLPANWFNKANTANMEWLVP